MEQTVKFIFGFSFEKNIKLLSYIYSDQKHVSPLQNITNYTYIEGNSANKSKPKLVIKNHSTILHTKINLSDLLSNCSILFARIVYFSECTLNLVNLIS